MEKYSVLMSVYFREKPENLREAMESMMTQTVMPDEFVLVCDGDLTEELDAVVAEYEEKYPEIMRTIRIPKSPNWAEVLNIGLRECKNELVARMDSDDISVPDRCEKQLRFLEEHPEVACVSTSIGEFFADKNHIDNVRKLPETHEEIAKFAKMRCPLNHATAIYKKSAIIASGEYHYFPAYEDYHLWIRMINKGYILHNMPEILYLMRAGANLYERRGGVSYCKEMAKFRNWMRKQGTINFVEMILLIISNGAVVLMPNKLRAFVYETFLRGKANE